MYLIIGDRLAFTRMDSKASRRIEIASQFAIHRLQFFCTAWKTRFSIHDYFFFLYHIYIYIYILTSTQ